MSAVWLVSGLAMGAGCVVLLVGLAVVAAEELGLFDRRDR